MTSATSPETQFRRAYAEHRASEGRAHDERAMLELPYLAHGSAALVRQWSVRARTFDAFVAQVLRPAMRRLRRPVDLLDLGAGNGWLSYRAAQLGCRAIALDVRDDRVDGLGAGSCYRRSGTPFESVAASFGALPIADACVDLVVFNASLHYAIDLAAVLRESRRVLRPGGTLAVLDSPFYRRRAAGDAMVAEKRAHAAREFGARADALLALPFLEFLTREALAQASAPLMLRWRRHRVRYPLWYELRPLEAMLRRRRPPSRFDLWEGSVQ